MDSSDSSDDERLEAEERDARWRPKATDLIPPLIPATIADPHIFRARTEILDVYSETDFRQIFRFHKEPFLRIVDLLKDQLKDGIGAISPEKRVGLFLSYCSGNETQVELSFYPQIRVQTSPITVTRDGEGP